MENRLVHQPAGRSRSRADWHYRARLIGVGGQPSAGVGVARCTPDGADGRPCARPLRRFWLRKTAASYGPFVNELLRRILAANPDVKLIQDRRKRAQRNSFVVRRTVDLGFALAARLPAARLAAMAGAAMRRIGRFVPEHRVGRENLVAAFPEKSPAEIEDILRGVWDNLGRIGAEFAHLHRICDVRPGSRAEGRIVMDAATLGQFERLRLHRRPALIFSAHLANWELTALVARALDLTSRRAGAHSRITAPSPTPLRAPACKNRSYIFIDRNFPA